MKRIAEENGGGSSHMNGTHKDAWMSLDATRRKVSVPLLTIHRVAGGKIADDWVLIGPLLLVQQVGVLASTEEILQRSTG